MLCSDCESLPDAPEFLTTSFYEELKTNAKACRDAAAAGCELCQFLEAELLHPDKYEYSPPQPVDFQGPIVVYHKSQGEYAPPESDPSLLAISIKHINGNHTFWRFFELCVASGERAILDGA